MRIRRSHKLLFTTLIAFVFTLGTTEMIAQDDQVAKNTTTQAELAVGSVVAYKSAGAFTAVPPGLYDLSTRYAGQTTNAISRTGVSFSAGRVYTITARGDITVTSTTATNRPFLDNTTNR